MKNINRMNSISRITLLLKQDAYLHWGEIIWHILLLYVVGILFSLIMGGIYTPEANADIKVQQLIVGLVDVASLFGFYYLSAMASVLSTKKKRIVYGLFPATIFEKFMSRWLYVIIKYLVIIFGVFVLFGFTVFLFDFYVGIEFDYNIDMKQILGICIGDWLGGMRLWFGYSLFIMGGCLWSKNAFIKMMGLFLLICFCLTIIVGKSYNGEINTFGGLPDVVAGIIWGLCAFLLNVIAYFAFKRSLTL